MFRPKSLNVFFTPNLAINIDHFNEKTGRIKSTVLLPNYNRAFRPYIDILFILSLDILKKDIAYVHISFALYLVVVASHPMLSITGTLFDPYLITHQEMECFEIV